MIAQPLFQDCQGGGAGQRALYVAYADAGAVTLEMWHGVGPNVVQLVHTLPRASVVELQRALGEWLASPESAVAATVPNDE